MFFFQGTNTAIFFNKNSQHTQTQTFPTRIGFALTTQNSVPLKNSDTGPVGMC
jgi:hypothetical protein